MNGTIKKLTDKNFGFITSEEADKDIFFHANELQGVTFLVWGESFLHGWNL